MKQPMVVLSSTKSEYMSAFQATQEVVAKDIVELCFH
jgi:hypothetical protein